MYRKQKGITLIGFIFGSALVVIVALIAMQVTPVYIQYYAVVRSMNDLNNLPKDEINQNPEAGVIYLKEYLSRKLYINEIRFISKRDMKVRPRRGRYEITVPYTVEKKLVGNVYLLFKFKPSCEVSIEKQ